MPKKRKVPKAAQRKAAPIAKPKTAGKAKSKAAPSTKPKAASRARNPGPPQTAAQPVPRTIFDILPPGAATESDPSFRDAPENWTPAYAQALAAEAGLTLTEDHWEVIRVLQGCYKDEVAPRIRLLRDALEARFASKGGMKYLFGILPGGPIAQGCGLAGLKPPHGARDLSFGSVA
jgi:tRNA 2-thiouridine synthesizing protein E